MQARDEAATQPRRRPSFHCLCMGTSDLILSTCIALGSRLLATDSGDLDQAAYSLLAMPVRQTRQSEPRLATPSPQLFQH